MRIEILDNVFVRRFGDFEAPKLICLHGFGDNSHMFVPLADTHLVKQFELVAVDLPGFGASPRNPSVNSIEEFAKSMVDLASFVSPGQAVGLIAHSVASVIAVAMVEMMTIAPLSVFSIEGNLTAADAYFSGQAADWDSASAFKNAFAEQIWDSSKESEDLRRYFGGVVMADADAMWALGKDARRVSTNDAVGKAFQALEIPTLYYWNSKTTTASTREFIAEHSLNNQQYEAESHWPTVASPDTTAAAIDKFFSNVS